MLVTNKHGLPNAIVRAVQNDSYSKGGADISVTELISPPRLVALRRRHDAILEEDASDRIWSLLGQAVHSILERADVMAITERRIEIEVDGWKLSGGLDRLAVYQDEQAGWTIEDYKVTSVWSTLLGGKIEWERQLNVLCYLVQTKLGININRLRVVAILRDWSKPQSYQNDDYPDRQVVSLPVPKWETETQRTYIAERIALHKAARGGGLPLCSEEDRWARPDQWAVMLNGKRARRVLPTSEEAQEWVRLNKLEGAKGLTIVKRPGISARCEHYCPVSKFCDQYMAMSSGNNHAAE